MSADIYFFARYVSLLELLWTIIGIVGIYFACKNVLDSFKDLASQAASKDGDEILSIIAVASIRADLFRAIQLVMVILIGVLSFKVQTPDPAPPMTTYYWTFVIAMFVIGGGPAINSIADERVRKRIAAIYERQKALGEREEV